MFSGQRLRVCTKLRREVHLWTARFPQNSGASLTCGAVSFQDFRLLDDLKSNWNGEDRSPFILQYHHAEGYVIVNHRALAAVNKQHQDDPLSSEMEDDGRLFFQGDAMACLDDDKLRLLKARLTLQLL